MEKPDSLIFDMDGTLWDAVDTYAACWEIAFSHIGIERKVKREELIAFMGMEIKEIAERCFPEMNSLEQTDFLEDLYRLQDDLVSKKGGTLFEGVKEGIAQLSSRYRLFLLSNCEKNGLNVFMNVTGIGSCITGSLTYGHTKRSKGYNLQLLKSRYDLKSPVYIGDTDGDSKQCRLAGVPFIYVTYGFGKTNDYDLSFDSFNTLKNHLMSL